METISLPYRVHVTKEGNSVNFTTNGTVLATIAYREDINKYELANLGPYFSADTYEEVDQKARLRVRKLLASFGVRGVFLDEQ